MLDFDLANKIWRVLKGLPCSIHEAADPAINPFKALPSHINLTRLHELEMSFPCILQIKNFSQNMLLYTTTCEEIHWLFTMTQTIRIEILESIVEAKWWCGILGRVHSWHWAIHKRINLDWFPALSGQPLLLSTASEPSNSNTIILHPHLLTQSRSLTTNIFRPLLPSPRPPDYLPTDVNTDLTDLMQWVELSELLRLGGLCNGCMDIFPFRSY